jgi:hypothetical protein
MGGGMENKRGFNQHKSTLSWTTIFWVLREPDITEDLTSLPLFATCFCWFLTWLTHRPCRWRRNVPPKRRDLSERHHVATGSTVLFRTDRHSTACFNTWDWRLHREENCGLLGWHRVALWGVPSVLYETAVFMLLQLPWWRETKQNTLSSGKN